MRIQGTKTDPVRLSDLYAIVADVSTALYSGNVIVDDQAPRQLSGRSAQMKLRTRDSRAPGSRRTRSGRRAPIACWHAYRDVIRSILKLHPDATIRTGMALYKGLAGFEETYPGTAYINVGSMFEPACPPDLCECPSSIADTPDPFSQIKIEAEAKKLPQIEVGNAVAHKEYGWTAFVRKIEGKSFGERIITVEEFDGHLSDWLEHALVKKEN